MDRVNFLHVEVKVFPASIKEGRHTGYNHDTLLIADEPVLVARENILDLDAGQGELMDGIVKWINHEMRSKGKELIYQNCPIDATEE